MNRVVDWFARNSVAANLLMILILVAGAVSLTTTKQEVFPEFSLDLITVQVEYLGAAPEEVEEAVCVRIEEAIQGIDGVKEIRSTSSEGFGTVVVELELGADAARVLDDVKSRVDAIDTFPEETEKPIVQELTNRRQVIFVAVWGDADETTLKVLAERVRDEISALDGITLVELSSARPYEISIEVSERALRKFDLTFDQVANAVRRTSLDLPGGTVKTEAGEILLRAKGQAERGPEFEDIVVITRPDGAEIRLRDVATVVDGFAETDLYSRFEGERAIMVEIFRTGDQAPLDMVEQIEAYVSDAQRRMPEGVYITPWQDAAKVLRDRLELLIRNGIAGLVLVFTSLALFLRFRLAFWVSLGIPISFLGAAMLMPTLDVSVNLISLFAFIVVLGIVVDDAIVAGENIFTRQTGGSEPQEGAIRGAQEIATPIIFAVLTTIAAFFPLLQVEGTIGKIMRVIPLVVIPCLLFSLVESLLILPAHLRHRRGALPLVVFALVVVGGAALLIVNRDGPYGSLLPWWIPLVAILVLQAIGKWRAIQRTFGSGLERFIEHVYRPSLDLGLRFRYVTLAVGVGTLVLTVGMVAGGFVRFTFFPDVEADYVSVAVTMPQGTPDEVTSEAVAQLEASADEVRTELIETTGEDPFRYVISTVGAHPYRQAQDQNAGRAATAVSSSHLGEVTIELTPAEARALSSTELVQRWRERTPPIPDAVEVSYSSSLFSPGEDINVQLTGPNFDALRDAATALKARLAEYPNVSEISDSFREGKRELKLDIKPEAEILGLTLSDLARQVRQAFYGEEAQRIVRGRDDIRVMVRYPEDERRSIGDLENMRIRAPDGREVPFSRVAEVDAGRGYSTIQRVDRRRAVNVTADVDDTRGASTGDIIAELDTEVIPEVLSSYPGVLYSFEGQNAEQRDTIGGLMRGFAIAMITVFALLAVPLRSYVQPVIIMLAIPFGLVGAIWGHVIMGINLTILSMFGIVALSGVVVNDSLVMVDFINRRRADGMRLFDAVHDSGIARFRAILLTSLTTFLGLSPLMLERSMQARFLIPMAVSLAFGVVFSTFITLVLVPSAYIALEDVVRGTRRLFGLPATTDDDDRSTTSAGPSKEPGNRERGDDPVGAGAIARSDAGTG